MLCAQANWCQVNQDDSSTFRVVGKDDFNISYVDETSALGDYFTDTLQIGNGEVQDFQMGLATNTSIGIGIMGLGFSNSESNIYSGNGTEYPNLPLALVNQGLISTPAYSLWLDDVYASTGSILFGGIDTTKYTGQLSSIQVYPNSKRGNNITSFTVAFTSLSATSSTGTDTLTPAGYAEPVILDSGTTLTLLPDPIAALVFAELGATSDQQLGVSLVPCSLANNTGTLNFGFAGPGGPEIKIPMRELVLPLTLKSGSVPFFNDGAQACQLGIQAAGNLPTLFGDTFLRSAYVVYDLDNARIGMAQTNFGAKASEPNIVEFPSRGAPIPSATSASASIQLSPTESGSPRGSNEAGGQTAVSSGAAGPQATVSQGGGLSAASGFAESESEGTRIEDWRWNLGVVVACWTGLMVVGGGSLVWA